MTHPSETSHPLSAVEYEALRATIRERGSLRVFVTAITFVSWAALALTGSPDATLRTIAPLVVLAGGFEVVFALHVGVERIGRYLAVHYERAGSLPAWEGVAGRLGAHPSSATGVDPLFAPVFAVAALANLLTLDWSVGPRPTQVVALLLVLAAHAGVLLRLVRARRFAAGQRARDEALFRDIPL